MSLSPPSIILSQGSITNNNNQSDRMEMSDHEPLLLNNTGSREQNADGAQRRKNTRPLKTHCSILVLTIGIGVLLLVQTVLNVALTRVKDYSYSDSKTINDTNITVITCTDYKDSRYLLLTVGSTYILPVSVDNKDGIVFSFTNDEDAMYYSLTFQTSNTDRTDLQPENEYNVQVEECQPDEYIGYGRHSCGYVVRNYPPNVGLSSSSTMTCDERSHNWPVYVLFKWITVFAEVETLSQCCNNDAEIIPDCSDFSGLICLGNADYIFETIINQRPPTDDTMNYQTLALRYCRTPGANIDSLDSIDYDITFKESYKQLIDTSSPFYKMGLNNGENVTIPFTAGTGILNIEIRLEGPDNIKTPMGIQFNYYRKVNISKQENITSSTYSIQPALYTRFTMYFNAVISPILTLTVITVIILYCTQQKYIKT